LEETIKLCPRGTPRQRTAEVPWIESVFLRLSQCAGEWVSSKTIKSSFSQVDTSPMANMLQVIYEQKVSLTPGFLETILLDHSGLFDKEPKSTANWKLISVLLRLGGNIFLKKPETEQTEDNRSNYVDALLRVLASERWKRDDETLPPRPSLPKSLTYPFEVSWDESRSTVVKQIVIPLLQAYASARNLSGFLSIWFRELRRDWSELGTPEEGRLVWTSDELHQNFWDLLEGSLTAAKINEHIVEYVLPVKVLAGEAAQKSDHAFDWPSSSAAPPASAALVILDAILHGIDREEIFQQNLPTWLSLNDLILQYTKLDMSEFRCASRIWSILTRLQELSTRVEVEEPIQVQKTSLLASGVLDSGLNVIGLGAKTAASFPQYNASREAYRFVVAVCSEVLDFPDLKSRAEEYIKAANVHWDRGYHFSHPTHEYQFFDNMTALSQYPRCLM